MFEFQPSIVKSYRFSARSPYHQRLGECLGQSKSFIHGHTRFRFVIVSKSYILTALFGPSFTQIAITTVGYGEITPRSFLGKLITLPLLVFGLLLIALPSFVLGREFSLVWEKMAKDQVHFLS
jgi:hypothetical protein